MTKTVIGERFKSVFVASLASMTLVAPIMTLITFLSYMIADGLAMMFSYAKGRNNQAKANELFSMGIIFSVAS